MLLAVSFLTLCLSSIASSQPFLSQAANSALQGMLYPRESESREVKDLSGLWNFRADMSPSRNQGFNEQWFTKPLSQSGSIIPMPVPSSYNDITETSALRDFIGWAWYDKEFYVPHGWYSNSTTRIVLRFESAHYYTIVWVNGKEVMQHNGGHLPFEADVTNLLEDSKVNRVTAAVNNTLTLYTLPPGDILYLVKPDGWYPPGYFVQTYEFDFFNYAGIHRPVRLYTTPVTYLSDITVVTNFDDSLNVGTVKFSSAVGASYNSMIGTKQIKMEYILKDKGGLSVASTSGVEMLEGELKVMKPILWWPVGMSDQTAYLYTLQVTVSTVNTSDVYRLPVGIRTVKVEGTKFLINNKPFYFKGVGKHEDADIRGKGLDLPTITKDFNLLQWLGANAFRTSHYPYAEEIMDMADQQGIVVIDECPAVGLLEKNFNPKTLAHHLQVMKELIQRDKNRPAVVMWSLANEPRTNVPASDKYFQSVFELTRSLDPIRPATFVTNQRALTDKAAKYADVLMVNRYYAWYHDPGHLELISRQLEHELTDWYNEFKKPVIQAEYGADAVAGLHILPSMMFTEDYQVDTIERYFPVFDKLRKTFFIGEMIWNFADFMTQQDTKRVVGNKKGIFTRERQPKAAAHVLRKRYQNITFDEVVTQTGDLLLDTLIKFESRDTRKEDNKAQVPPALPQY